LEYIIQITHTSPLDSFTTQFVMFLQRHKLHEVCQGRFCVFNENGQCITQRLDETLTVKRDRGRDGQGSLDLQEGKEEYYSYW
jgi:hypothetical protein